MSCVVPFQGEKILSGFCRQSVRSSREARQTLGKHVHFGVEEVEPVVWKNIFFNNLETSPKHLEGSMILASGAFSNTHVHIFIFIEITKK